MDKPSSKKATRKPAAKPAPKSPKNTTPKTPPIPPRTKAARAARSQVLAHKAVRELVRNGIGPNSEQFKGGTISQGAFAPYVIS